VSRTSTWVAGAAGSLYDIDNLPYATYSVGGNATRIGARIGDFVLDLKAAATLTHGPVADALSGGDLGSLMSAGPLTWIDVRRWLTEVLTDTSSREELVPLLHPIDDVDLHLPFVVRDFVDFYASIDHASNVGRIFRPQSEPLLPNWRHMPVSYHGRGGSVVVSGTPVRRPCGQVTSADQSAPAFGPSRQLDIEAELGFIVGQAAPHGTRVTTAGFRDHVFGVVGVNDWSARDIQAWEYAPLGPHLSKSFATSVSAWVTPLAALEPATYPMAAHEPDVVSYLVEDDRQGYDVSIEIEVNGTIIATAPYSAMYWSPAQMLAHMTVNGSSLRIGDLYASGTVSGPTKQQRGCLLELSWGGREPWLLSDGRQRTYLEDGDEVVLRPTAPGRLGRIGLGEVRGTVIAADLG